MIDAACFKGSFLTACRCAGNAGRVITMGFSVDPDDINQFVITSKELDVRGSRLQNRRFQTVIDLVEKGQVDLKEASAIDFISRMHRKRLILTIPMTHLSEKLF